jgi:excisionase family DNA binding protein
MTVNVHNTASSIIVDRPTSMPLNVGNSEAQPIEATENKCRYGENRKIQVEALRCFVVPARPLVLSIDECCNLIGVRRTTLYSLAREGRIRKIKIGRRSLITMDSIEALIRDAQTEGGE